MVKELPVVYLQTAACSGCAVSLLNTASPTIKNVLIDQITIDLAQGKTPYQAVLDSAMSRMRPVSMAAITTVLGMIPLLPDTFFQAMSITIMAGLTFATILTLVVVPVLYTIFYRIPAEK